MPPDHATPPLLAPAGQRRTFVSLQPASGPQTQADGRAANPTRHQMTSLFNKDKLKQLADSAKAAGSRLGTQLQAGIQSAQQQAPRRGPSAQDDRGEHHLPHDRLRAKLQAASLPVHCFRHSPGCIVLQGLPRVATCCRRCRCRRPACSGLAAA